ncbi:hypothetical protein U0C82_03415 [Fulvimarina sp. 2208YS6-2-32]|uniref:Uncharacterized protein n=1 Tax=Fulvimarina uroteuthidis TaxID=3098149 RepID=A0ABU5HZN5_9HYPH|nr:hypothetical protein [Fulvimarina sp. 2208YS6-2-32]MDY8108198.1 hypothetical protein [Fulvimarina sp. 2208YS6-2-32]
MATNNYTDLSMRKVSPPKGIFRNALDRMIEARERQARAYVRQNLSVYGRDFDEMVRSAPHDVAAPRR